MISRDIRNHAGGNRHGLPAVQSGGSHVRFAQRHARRAVAHGAGRSLLGFFHEEDARLAYKALARVGIMERRISAPPTSPGGQQRAAIARALVQRARVLLADEPIASLDPESSRNVMETLRDLNQKDGLTVLVTLHQVDYALSFCPRTIALKHGRVVYDGPSAELTPAFLKRLYGTECDSLFARQESDIRRNPPLTQVQVA
ncbi:MAG: ATP-binding cassette domain-containing protein [Bilophila wadsworthia]